MRQRLKTVRYQYHDDSQTDGGGGSHSVHVSMAYHTDELALAYCKVAVEAQGGVLGLKHAANGEPECWFSLSSADINAGGVQSDIVKFSYAGRLLIYNQGNICSRPAILAGLQLRANNQSGRFFRATTSGRSKFRLWHGICVAQVVIGGD